MSLSEISAVVRSAEESAIRATPAEVLKQLRQAERLIREEIKRAETVLTTSPGRGYPKRLDQRC